MFLVKEIHTLFITILLMTPWTSEKYISLTMEKTPGLFFLKDKRFQRSHRSYNPDKKMLNNLTGLNLISIQESQSTPSQENSKFLESIHSLKTTCFQNTERTLRSNLTKSLEFLTLLEFKFPHTTDLVMKKTLSVTSTDSNQRNLKETFSNTLIMMEKFLDSLQDSILKYLKM